MSINPTISSLVLAIAIGTTSHLIAADSPKSAAAKPAKPEASKEKTAIEAAGLRISGINLSLPEEVEFKKSLDKAVKQKKSLTTMESASRKSEAEIKEVEAHITQLKGEAAEYNAQLAKVNNVLQNNQLVGAINALNQQIETALKNKKDLTDAHDNDRKRIAEAREEFIELLLGMRTAANAIKDQWTTLAADAALQEAVATETKSKGKLAPGATFIAGEKQLESFEKLVLSEVIPLKVENGGMWVDVSIGRKTCRMVVDSGATCISLPFNVAKDLGIEPTSKDEEIQVSLANGSVIKANKLTVDDVRVGKFIARDVEVIVLKPDAVAAPTLLGMSFLGNFKFEVNQQKAELRLVKLDIEDPSSKGSRSKPASTKGGKK